MDHHKYHFLQLWMLDYLKDAVSGHQPISL